MKTLIARSRGVVISQNTFVPQLHIDYAVADHPEKTEMLPLNYFLKIITGEYLNEPFCFTFPTTGAEIALTSLQGIVPWLLAGLKHAVTANSTHDLLKMIESIRQHGHKDSELDSIEQSLRA